MDFIYTRKRKKTGADLILCVIDAVASPNDDFDLLKATTLVFFVALIVLTVILLYFVTKKVMVAGHTRVFPHPKPAISEFWVFPQKPKYQPQLQMIQMVGPNENDYVYINFKDFDYDTKWEFPRENLELGISHTRQALNVHSPIRRK